MERLRSCPFCGKDVAEVGTVAENAFMDMDHPEYDWASEHYQVVCNYLRGGCGAATGGGLKTPEEAVKAWNRRPSKITYGSPETDLTGKCGSCRWGEQIEHCGSFCYVRCTNPELSTRTYYGRFASKIKQRTSRACKKYEVRE